jgi:hypothetical protein
MRMVPRRRAVASLRAAFLCAFIDLARPVHEEAASEQTGAPARANLAALSCGGKAWALRNQELDGFSISASIDNNFSSSNGWAFDGGLSDAYALFALGSCDCNLATGCKEAESEGEKTGLGCRERLTVKHGRVSAGKAAQCVDEIAITTAVGRHDHHISMLRLWYSDVLDSSWLVNKSTAEQLLRRPAENSSIFRPLPLESACVRAAPEEGTGKGEGGEGGRGVEGRTGWQCETQEGGGARGGQTVDGYGGAGGGAVVEGHRVLTRGGAKSERILVKFRPVPVTAILLKVDATDAALCDRRVSSSEADYSWQDAQVNNNFLCHQ